jgi:hypothetical protein
MFAEKRRRCLNTPSAKLLATAFPPSPPRVIKLITRERWIFIELSRSLAPCLHFASVMYIPSLRVRFGRPHGGVKCIFQRSSAHATPTTKARSLSRRERSSDSRELSFTVFFAKLFPAPTQFPSAALVKNISAESLRDAILVLSCPTVASVCERRKSKFFYIRKASGERRKSEGKKSMLSAQLNFHFIRRVPRLIWAQLSPPTPHHQRHSIVGDLWSATTWLIEWISIAKLFPTSARRQQQQHTIGGAWSFSREQQQDKGGVCAFSQ